MTVERKNTLKEKIGYLKLKNYTFERVETHLQERIKNANKTHEYFMVQFFFSEMKTYLKTKTDTKEHNNKQKINMCTRNLDTNKDK
jgi:hypothetical protein